MRTELGSISSEPSGYEVILERTLNHPIEKVWAALTEADQLKVWLMETSVLELEVGGAIGFAEEGMRGPGTITELAEPTLIEYSWLGHEPPHSTVRFELAEATIEPGSNSNSNSDTGTDTGTRLRLIHRKMPTDGVAAEHGGGWHTHLETLDALLDGDPLPEFWPRFHELHPIYQERGRAVSNS